MLPAPTRLPRAPRFATNAPLFLLFVQVTGSVVVCVERRQRVVVQRSLLNSFRAIVQHKATCRGRWVMQLYILLLTIIRGKLKFVL